MDLKPFAEWAQATGVAEWMRTSLKAMPVVEAIHVLCVALIFGTILIVDLRMLGYPHARRPWTRTYNELIRVTWAAFGAAVITGAMMFAPNAVTYVGNTAFQFKMLTLLLVGINMIVFQLITARTVAHWDQSVDAPMSARVAGVLSILLWITVIFLGRWIGFTKGYDFTVPEDVQFEFPAN
jgi:hypothetical protein